MTTLREAAAAALEALGSSLYPQRRQVAAIAALKAALAEPVQEPVQEHEDWCASVTQLLLCDPPRKAPCNCKKTVAEPVQEEIYWYVGTDGKYYSSNEVKLFMDANTKGLHLDPPQWRKDKGDLIPLYTAPPQRKPLTEEEIRDLWSWAMTAEAERTATTQQHAFARAIERAHGIGGEE